MAGAVGDAVFTGTLRAASPSTPSGKSADEVIAAGITSFRTLPPQYVQSWLAGYSQALSANFAFIAGLAGLALVGSCFMEMDGLRKRRSQGLDRCQQHEHAGLDETLAS